MNFLNLGWLEILVILLVAFIILGPDRLTQVGHEMGSWMRKLSRSEMFRDVVQSTEELRNYPRKIMDEAMLDQSLPTKQPLEYHEGAEPITKKDTLVESERLDQDLP